jgi:hypothetical protein
MAGAKPERPCGNVARAVPTDSTCGPAQVSHMDQGVPPQERRAAIELAVLDLLAA